MDFYTIIAWKGLIKHILKRGFQKYKIFWAKERIWQPLSLNAAQKFKIQKK